MSNLYTKIPVTIQAFQFGPDFFTLDVRKKWPEWLNDAFGKHPEEEGAIYCSQDDQNVFIHTLEGEHLVSVGDWIIQGVKGELYPCKPDIFAATYTPEEQADAAPPEIPPEARETKIEDGMTALDVLVAFHAQISRIPRQSGAVLKMGYGYHYHLARSLSYVCAQAKALEMQEQYLAQHGYSSGSELLRRYDEMKRRFDFAAHLERQRQFSESAFGPGPRTEAVLDHITKEIEEVRAKPGDVFEWVDIVILGLDGAWRAGHTPDEIIDALVVKQTRNENRTWPDWRTADPTKAIEHDRTGE